jgi:hypothetical protein
MKEKNFEMSMHMGRPLFESIEQTGVGIVATGCGTCKIQIEQGSGLPVVHPIRIVRDSLLGGPLPPRVAAVAAGRPCAPARSEPASADEASACPE